MIFQYFKKQFNMFLFLNFEFLCVKLLNCVSVNTLNCIQRVIRGWFFLHLKFFDFYEILSICLIFKILGFKKIFHTLTLFSLMSFEVIHFLFFLIFMLECLHSCSFDFQGLIILNFLNIVLFFCLFFWNIF